MSHSLALLVKHLVSEKGKEGTDDQLDDTDIFVLELILLIKIKLYIPGCMDE